MDGIVVLEDHDHAGTLRRHIAIDRIAPDRELIMIGNSVVVAFALLLMMPSASAAGIQGVEVGDLNRDVEPCADFYEFANGTWRTENPIPESKSRWSRRLAAQDANRLHVQRLLEELAQKSDWPSGSDEQRIGDYFASCMDEESIDAAG